MQNQIHNHFSYLYENKNGFQVNKRKTITKNKDASSKSSGMKKKNQYQEEEREMKKEDTANILECENPPFFNKIKNETSLFHSNPQSATQFSDSLNPSSENNLLSYYPNKSQFDVSSFNLIDTQSSHYGMQDKNQHLHKISFNQINNISDFDSFDENNRNSKLNNDSYNFNSSQGNQQSQLIQMHENKQINKEQNLFDLYEMHNNTNAAQSQMTDEIKIKSQPIQHIQWRRANQLQTKPETKLRELNDPNQVLLQGDLCISIEQNEYSNSLNYVPLSAYKRITEVKKYHEGKYEAQMITDVKGVNNVQMAKYEEEGMNSDLNNAFKFTCLDQQIKMHLQKIEQQSSTFSEFQSQSASIISKLKEHVSIKKEQYLNKIDFERKYVFAVELANDNDGISQISKLYYSKGLLNILGLDSKDSALVETYLLQNKIIDLHEQIGFYEKNNIENKGELQSQYLQPLSSGITYKLKTLDNLSLCVSINHRIINLSEEFIQMFSVGQTNISTEYFILYELDIPYDQIKQIENERRSTTDKLDIIYSSSNMKNNQNLLISKYYSNSNNTSSFTNNPSQKKYTMNCF